MFAWCSLDIFTCNYLRETVFKEHSKKPLIHVTPATLNVRFVVALTSTNLIVNGLHIKRNMALRRHMNCTPSLAIADILWECTTRKLARYIGIFKMVCKTVLENKKMMKMKQAFQMDFLWILLTY